jgi:hypothetical protein
MTENQQLRQVNEATWNVIDSLRETSQAVTESVTTLQDRNLKFAQNIFLGWTELLTQQTESVQRLQQQWGQQARKQQDAFQRLASASMQIYMDLLLTPFSFSRQLIDVTEGRLQREREEVH